MLMKRNLFLSLGVVLSLLISLSSAHATNDLFESGPYAGSWTNDPSTTATLNSGAVLSYTATNILTGWSLFPPEVLNASFTEGSMYRRIFRDTQPSYFETNGLRYFMAPLSFSPNLPNLFTNVGTYTYTSSIVGIPSGLLAWWPGEGNANERIYTNNGTVTNVTFDTGMVGQAFHFSGGKYADRSHVSVDTSDYTELAGNFSVEAWVNLDRDTNNTIVAKGDPNGFGNKDWALLIVAGGRLRPHVLGGTSWQYVDCDTVMTTGQWHHVAMTFDGTTLKGYVNGVLDGYRTVSGRSHISDGHLTIGAYDSVGTHAMAGRVDELSLYNRALSGSEIQAIYAAGSAGKQWDGSPANGVPMLSASFAPNITNQVGTFTVHVLDPLADDDYDGISNGQEMAQGTDPKNANSVSNIRLGHWTFNDGTFVGEDGQMPTFTNGAVLHTGLIINAATLANPGNSNYVGLVYRDVETSGQANINCRNGSVRLWFQPNWTSGPTGGPQDWSRLLEIGSWDSTNGEFELTFTPTGEGLFFHTGFFTNGGFAQDTMVTASISWQSNQWYQVVITYSPTNTALYINGQLQMTNRGVSVWPTASLRAQTGLHIGNNRYLASSPNGQIDELETFNYPLEGTEISSNYNYMLTHASYFLAQNDPYGDFDYDGIPNLMEYQASTDAGDPASVTNTLLSSFRFENYAYRGDQGQANLISSHHTVLTNGGIIGRAVSFIATNSLLEYSEYQTNAIGNINCRNGTVLFWMRPEWSSQNNGGNGPQCEARILEVGQQNQSNGWWAIHTSPDGHLLFLDTQSNNVPLTCCTAMVSWVTGQWQQVAVTYSPSNSFIFLNGALAASNNVGPLYPNALGRTNGMCLGNSHTTNQSIQATLDEVEIYNYPLCATLIMSNYQHMLTNSPTFLAQVFPWGDYDYDAEANEIELQDGTDPLDPRSAKRKRLGVWRFNDATLVSEQGALPISTNGIMIEAGLEGNGVRIPSQGSGVSFAYHDVETNGQANVNCRNGTLRFWFKPLWNTGVDEGPGTNASLFEIGAANSPDGDWALRLTEEGDGIYFTSSGTSTNATNAWAPLTLASNQWYQIALTYSPSNSAIYLNGTNITSNNTGVSSWPAALARIAGFRIGQDSSGNQTPNGVFDFLETFNYPLAAGTIANDYLAGCFAAQMGFDVDSDLDGRSNEQELMDGTAPNNALSVANVLSARFRFEQSTFTGDQGQVPTYANGVTLSSGAVSNGVLFAGCPSNGLAYASLKPDGTANLNCQQGSIRFWFTPLTNTGVSNMVFLQSGDGGDDWRLAINDDGSRLQFCTTSNGVSVTNIWATIRWSSTDWRQVVLTYSPTSCCLYVNAQLVAADYGFSLYPSVSHRTNGLWIGNDASGLHPVSGIMDELEIFSYPLSQQEVLNHDTDGDGRTDWQEFVERTDPLDSTRKNDKNVKALGPVPCGVRVDLTKPFGLECHFLSNNTFTFIITNASTNAWFEIYSCVDAEKVNWSFVGEMMAFEPDGTNYCQFWGTNTVKPPTNGGAFYGWTVARKVDTDLDGRSDGRERFIDRTSPSNDLEVLSVHLASWDFNTANNDGNTEEYQLYPAFHSGVTNVPSWHSNALSVPASTNLVGLVYTNINSDNYTIITRRQGTLRFWFQPNWSSGPGQGPQHSATLVEMGTYGDPGGWWWLGLDASGQNLQFATAGDGIVTTNLIAPIQWSAGAWYQIALTYAPSGTILYTNGTKAADGLAVLHYPSANLLATTGLRIGRSHVAGYSPNGQYEDIETFNYQLGQGNILSNFQGVVATSPILLAQIDPNGDFDLDGRSNLQERQDGTDATDPTSVTNLLLSRFRFDTSNYVGDQGQVPIYSNGVTSVPGVLTNGVLFSGGGASGLKYATTNSNGLANLDCKQGSIRFWFKPQTVSALSNAVFLQTGEGGDDWRLGMAANGTNLFFATAYSGVSVTNLSAPVLWTNGVWHQIVLTYSKNASTLYVDGEPVALGNGISFFPNPLHRLSGFWVGNDASGTHPAMGVFDELEVFNYLLIMDYIKLNYQSALYNSVADFDNDNFPNYKDAQPLNPAVGNLLITIDAPTNNAVLH